MPEKISVWMDKRFWFGLGLMLLPFGLALIKDLKPDWWSPKAPYYYKAMADETSRLLQRQGFNTTLYEYSKHVVVDFYNPRLERKLKEKKARADYAQIMSRGSLDFTYYGVEGDIPVPFMRPEDIGGFEHAELDIPPPHIVSSVHFHQWDSQPAAHIHIVGKYDPYDIARVIGRANELSEHFLEKEIPILP